MVTHPGSARTARSARRLNAPRPALVEAHADGPPRRLNRQEVAVVREEWRVVDRWWTEEPVTRRYFDVVLESGREHRRLPRRRRRLVVHPARVTPTRP